MVSGRVPAGRRRPEVIASAVRRTILWAERCRRHHSRADQALFAIVQGGTNLDLRDECARELAAMDFPATRWAASASAKRRSRCTRPCRRAPPCCRSRSRAI